MQGNTLTIKDLRFCITQSRQWFEWATDPPPVPFGMFVLETSGSEKTRESTKNGQAKQGFNGDQPGGQG